MPIDELREGQQRLRQQAKERGEEEEGGSRAVSGRKASVDGTLMAAKQLLEAGKAVLLEKPVADTVEEAESLGPLVAANPAIAEACHSDRVIALFKSTKKRARLAGWVLLFYALWHRQHVQRRQPEGDVFDVLSTI